MKRYFWMVLFCLTFAFPAVAESPSRASLEKLFLITNTKTRIDDQYSMMLPNLKQALKNFNPPGTDNPEARREVDRAFNIALPKMVKLFREKMGWKSLKEDYIKLYAATFSQEEINGLISFYQSPLGRSYLEKLPILTLKSGEITQNRMQLLYPEMNQIVKDTIEDLKATPQEKKN
jgi:uncharacterized protein